MTNYVYTKISREKDDFFGIYRYRKDEYKALKEHNLNGYATFYCMNNGSFPIWSKVKEYTNIDECEIEISKTEFLRLRVEMELLK